ncbi:MAG: hypothetical protein K2L78_03590 [Muribaculaceae bacterium]|nr:hypothetical protein [Muribaculaceae bacterium]
MSTENTDRPNLTGGETLNDRLRRAAAMARQDQQRRQPEPGNAATQPQPQQPQPAPRQQQPQPQQQPQVQQPRQESPREPQQPQPQQAPMPPYREAPRMQDDFREPRYAHRNTTEEYEPASRPADNKKSRKGLMLLIAALVVAVLAIIFLTVSHSREAARQQEQIEQLQLANEQIQLANEYDALNNEFAQYENQTSLLANDSIVQKYSAARAQVEKLLQELKNEKNKSAAQISKLKGEIETLKGILRNYVEQINALNQENQELRTENQEVKARNQQLSQSIQTVQANNKVLNERMTLAEKLNVTGVTLTPLNKKGKKEKNVTKARQLMVTFTIPQNNSTPVGEKTIWLRITNPEGDLLPGGGSFEFEGANLPATARKSIEYAGEEIGGVTVYWDVNTTLTPGDYTVELFCDNYRLASRKFTLKK